jgi:superfamily II DNA/RNA helicase
MKQARRLASLGKFKAGVASVMVATDVASRGLDIPSVGLVVNYNMPRAAEDYIHRVGRTARAGRGGTSVSLVTQFDISLLKHVESTIGRDMTELPDFDEQRDVLPLLNKVGTARKMGELRLEERGFGDDLAEASKRKKRARQLGAMFVAKQ